MIDRDGISGLIKESPGTGLLVAIFTVMCDIRRKIALVSLPMAWFAFPEGKWFFFADAAAFMKQAAAMQVKSLTDAIRGNAEIPAASYAGNLKVIFSGQIEF